MNTTSKKRILWVDDEVDMLAPHIKLLEQRGYETSTVTNGEDAVDWISNNPVDLVFLDESMPGIGGLETLERIKELRPLLHVVMVTKNEEESLMEEAIGKKISFYLTKPVNGSQILLAAKQFLEGKDLVGAKTAQDYTREFAEISMKLRFGQTLSEWIEMYDKLVKSDLELDQHPDLGLEETSKSLWRECNQEFSRFVESNYRDWINDDDIVMSPHVVDRFLLPHLESKGPVFFFVIDCMRYDQWLMLEKHLRDFFTVKLDFHTGILPTSTPYARNAIFSGYFPDELERVYPHLWDGKEDDEYSLNRNEEEFLDKLLRRRGVKLRTKLKYHKIIDPAYGKQVSDNISSLLKNHLTAIVVNFVDMLAHSRSDYPILKEIAPNESAFRSLTDTWFQHSSLFTMFKQIAANPDATIVVTTDHGSIRCMRGCKVLGDRETSTNLRYKHGRNVKVESKYAMQIKHPGDYKLPRARMTVNYIIAKEDYYFVYPTDYNKYIKRYRDSFQHGGISLEELILPVITLKPKR